ncbi:5-hydroxytryptamine receptor 1E-like [Paramacrobiotus metropolitanus]|uniref:5-hydroxytryptamine receptor 1E-like n=1 Tax=Paramacrobiotus metropolitanus TaxID=2943436 RepID=UPI002446007E|nr:5-hydroxytryptamine receptor 1E-like [Paramacrobiotus metropolitanus]
MNVSNITKLETLMRNATNISSMTGTPHTSTAYIGYLFGILTLFSYTFHPFFISVYCTTASLRTPFSVYVVSMSVCDLIKALTNGIAKITTNLNISWFLGDFYCLLTLYCAQTISPVVTYIQVLISVNRFWAVTFPNNYRTHHNKKVAAALVISVIVFVNAWSLLGFITESIYNRNPEQIRLCLLGFGAKKSVYFLLYGVVIHLVPQLLVIGIYPFIYYKVHKVMKNKAQIGQSTGGGSQAASKATVSTLVSRSQTDSGSTGTLRSVKMPMRTKDRRNETYSPHPAPQSRATRASGTRHFAVLTTLLISATLLWTPAHVAYILAMSGKYFNFTLLNVTGFFFDMDCTISPLLCLLASKDWREAVGGIWRSRGAGFSRK